MYHLQLHTQTNLESMYIFNDGTGKTGRHFGAGWEQQRTEHRHTEATGGELLPGLLNYSQKTLKIEKGKRAGAL